MEPLAVVTRSNYIESIHYGYVCVVDSKGKVLYSLGDYRNKIYFRSSAKPIQAIPLLESGAAENYGFSLQDIALVCSSHSGQSVHQHLVKQILERLNLSETYLRCGTMYPYNEKEEQRLRLEKEEPSVYHCSCSGKHSGMLALAKYRHYSLDNYRDFEHPVQQELLKTIAYFAEEKEPSIPLGIDGCGAPIYLLPINKIALSYAKLMSLAQNPRSSFYQACQTIIEAMVQYPEMVSGQQEFCTELMTVTKKKLIGKIGCEAVYCLGLQDQQLGICIKIVDGNERAVYPVVIQVLKELNILDQEELLKLENWHHPRLKNNLGEEIGAIIPILEFSQTKNKSLLGKHLSEIGIISI